MRVCCAWLVGNLHVYWSIIGYKIMRCDRNLVDGCKECPSRDLVHHGGHLFRNRAYIYVHTPKDTACCAVRRLRRVGFYAAHAAHVFLRCCVSHVPPAVFVMLVLCTTMEALHMLVKVFVFYRWALLRGRVTGKQASILII